MPQIIRFGTDGWRGVIADEYTFANVRRATQGFASQLLEQGRLRLTFVAGYAKRFQSENFAGGAINITTSHTPISGYRVQAILHDGLRIAGIS